MKLTTEQIKNHYKNSTMPENWYISGRDKHSDDCMWQATRDWNAARMAAGDAGRIVFFAAKDPETVLDFTDQAVREDVAKNLVKHYENGKLNAEVANILQNLNYIYSDIEADDDERLTEKLIEFLTDDLLPPTSGNGDGWFNCWQFAEWLYINYEPSLVKLSEKTAVGFHSDDLEVYAITGYSDDPDDGCEVSIEL